MLFKQGLIALLMFASLIVLVSCKKEDQNSMSFHDMKAIYYDHSNVMVLFRVGDALTGLPPKEIKPSDDQFIEVYEDGEKLSSSEGGNSSVGAPTTFIVDLLVLVDVSGSVESKISIVKQSLASFVKTLQDKSAGKTVRVSIRTFDGSAETKEIIGFTPIDQVSSKIELIQAGEDRSTNLHGAIVEAAKIITTHEVAGDAHPSLKKKGFIVFTDGKDQAARATIAEANRALSTIKTAADFVYGVAVEGETYGQSFLSSFGLKDRDYYLVDRNFTNLGLKFSAIVENLDAMARSYRVARICSPKRSGVHYINLKIKGSLYSSKYIEFNANGFKGGCDVKNHQQWTNPTTSKYFSASALLSYSERETSSQLFSQVRPGQSLVSFLKTATSPSAKGGWISNYSPFHGPGTVACHLYFPKESQSVVANEIMTIVDYASFNGSYNEGQSFIGANFVTEDSYGNVYLLQCRELKDLMSNRNLDSLEFSF